MTDDRDKFTLLHHEVETVHDRQWSFGRGIGFLDLEEFEIAVLVHGPRLLRVNFRQDLGMVWREVGQLNHLPTAARRLFRA